MSDGHDAYADRPSVGGLSTFLRIDPPELVGTTMVVRAVPAGPRERRRFASTSPLAYLYDRAGGDELDADLQLSAGHYDEANQVWSFSGEVTGIIGLTEPMTTAGTNSGTLEGRSHADHAREEPAAHVAVDDVGP